MDNLRLEKHEKNDSDRAEVRFIPKKLRDMISTETQEKYLKHARQNPLLKHVDMKRSLISLPICVRCERICTYDRRKEDPPPTYSTCPETGYPIKSKPYITCYHCGYHGVGGPTFRTHVREV